jgi:hypothetical protein
LRRAPLASTRALLGLVLLGLALPAAGCWDFGRLGSLYAVDGDGGAADPADAARYGDDLTGADLPSTPPLDGSPPPDLTGPSSPDLATPPLARFGDPCSASSACDASTHLKCVTSDGLAFTFPNGMCTLECVADDQCPTGGSCQKVGEISVCLPSCTAATTNGCRSGYSCCPDPLTQYCAPTLSMTGCT